MLGRFVAPSARRTTRKHASALLGAGNPSGAPTTKDFTEKGGPVEKWQPPRLCAPNRLKKRRDKFDVLPFYKSNQIPDDGACLIRIVRRVRDDRGAIRAPQL
jgi:hypothetical protein